MRLSAIFVIFATFLAAAVLSTVAAGYSVRVIEENSRSEVRRALDLEGLDWAETDADGLQLFLAGTAPTEATRFKAVTVAGRIVDAARIIDQMLVEDAAVIEAPRFSVEILRNDSGISLIGLIPAATDVDDFLGTVRAAAGGAEVADFLDRADYPTPSGWDAALEYAARSLKSLPRAKISVEAGHVAVLAMTGSPEAKRELETALTRRVPEAITLSMDISAPRPVITPFTLRFVIENGALRFDACSADTEEARARILSSAQMAGYDGEVACTIGLGVPSPQWGSAAELTIAALGDLGGGSVTFSDADISLIALRGTDAATFDDVIGGLEADLPEVFALHAVLPPPLNDTLEAAPEFVATLSPEGLVQLRGRLGSEKLRTTVDSFARARFSSGGVYTKARVVEGLPGDWPVRVLAGLEALSYLSNGAVTVSPDMISVGGNTGDSEASARIAGFLASKLGERAKFEIDVTYQVQLDPVASIPTAEECVQRIEVVIKDRKITFEPGSATIDAGGADIMNDIAEVLEDCGEIRIEIGGHTDSQGREAMNQQLSENRARAVLAALRARRVVTSTFTAVGYGEAVPIADNDTQAGREANRRIEFSLIQPEPEAESGTETQTGVESTAEQGEEDVTGDSTSTTADQDTTPDEQN